jgi:hypothetical protein
MKLASNIFACVIALSVVACSDQKRAEPAVANADMTAPFAFTAKQLPPHVVALSGFSHAEDWGRWTDGPTARIDFAKPLPAKFTLDLSVKYVYAANSAKPTQIKIGGKQVNQLFNLSGKRYSIALESDGKAQAIEFVIAEPAAPADIDSNPSGDKRKLGLGLADMKIIPQ